VGEGGATPVFADEQQRLQRVLEGFVNRIAVKNVSENVSGESANVAHCGGGHVSASQTSPSAVLSTWHVKLNIITIC
jgi:hypothetical protein